MCTLGAAKKNDPKSDLEGEIRPDRLGTVGVDLCLVRRRLRRALDFGLRHRRIESLNRRAEAQRFWSGAGTVRASHPCSRSRIGHIRLQACERDPKIVRHVDRSDEWGRKNLIATKAQAKIQTSTRPLDAPPPQLAELITKEWKK